MPDRLVTIAAFPAGEDAQAHLARIQLESHGIRTIMVGENLSAASPYCSYKPIELQVFEDKAEQAKKILQHQQGQEK
ncbi:MAG: putative signal transducing protein [Planctomycetota bacterium]|jgi:hypothetical protein